MAEPRGVPCITVPLATATCLLPMVWCVILLFAKDHDTTWLSHHYFSQVLPNCVYLFWATWMLLLAPLLALWGTGGVSTINEPGARSMVYIGVAAIYAIVLLAGHLLGAAETSKRQDAKTLFATKFNDAYCSARTFQACVQGNEHDILALVGRTPVTTAANNNTGSSNATSILLGNKDVSTAAFSVWKRCLEAHSRIERNQTGNTKYSDTPAYRLLDDCESSRAVDAWCGHYQLQNATLSSAKHLAPPSPFASNPHMFAKYTDEWARRLKYTDVLLGATIGCMVLASLLPKARE